MRVWRICKQRHAATAFSGDGARRVAGRWHLKGMPVVYTSRSLALAALETFVHVDPVDMPADLVAIPAEVPDGARHVARLDTSSLPRDWRSSPAPDALRELGAEWLTARRTLALHVPSAVIYEDEAPDEHNVLLNPEHPGFAAVVVGAPRPFVFDPRLRR